MENNIDAYMDNTVICKCPTCGKPLHTSAPFPIYPFHPYPYFYPVSPPYPYWEYKVVCGTTANN